MQLIIPALNEEARLPATLRALRGYALAASESAPSLEVIVVDNASTDATVEAALAESTPAMPIRVVRCERRGKGAAVRTGMALTTADVVAFMDADGATELDALSVADSLVARGADVAIASRAVEGSVTTERHSRVRAAGATLYRRMTREIVPGVADTQCGLKAFRGPLARRIFAQTATDGFSFDVEVLARARRGGASIIEFPVTWVDVPGSTFVPARHGFAAFWELVVISRRLGREGGFAPVESLTPEPPASLLPVAEA